MGLGNKLGQKNIIIQQQLNDARSIPSVGGYNNQNIPNLQNSAPLTQQQSNDIHKNIFDVEKLSDQEFCQAFFVKYENY